MLIPIQCEYFALEGVSELMRTLDRVRAAWNPELAVDGAVLTLYDERVSLSHQVVDEVRRFFGEAAFTDRDQAYGWKLFGETSEWVLNLLEDCEGVPSPQLTFQFLHYATNPLLLGQQSCHIPSRIVF